MDELTAMVHHSHEMVLSTEDAWTILQNKDNISVGNINIKGRISSISEIFRVNKDKLFLMIIDDMVNIIVMKEELLKWNEYLVPGHDYIFTRFKPATLKKGVDIPFKVFMPGSKSELFKDDDNIKTCSLTKWLERNSLDKDKLHLNLPKPTDKELDPGCKFVSYQGKIEKVISSEFGIYNLDGNILLHTSYLPASKRIVIINIGSTIIVYNVHHGTGKVAPRIHLYCCSKSTLQVVNSGPPTTVKIHNASYTEAVRTWVYHTINTYSLNRIECENLQHFYQTVYCLCKGLKREKYDVIRLLQSVLSTSCCLRLQPQPRNIIQEFFTSPHSCFFKQVGEAHKIPNIVTVESLLELASNQSDQIETLKTKHQHSHLTGKDLSEKLYWSYKLSPNQDTQGVIMGWLELCTTTGHLIFCDGKNRINTIITSNNNQHNCDRNCLDISSTTSHCPLLQLQTLGKILIVKSFCVVSEQFMVGQFSSIESLNTDSVDEIQHIPYLQFSMSDSHVFLPSKRNSSQSKCSLKDNFKKKKEGNSDGHLLETKSAKGSLCKGVLASDSSSKTVQGFTALRNEQRSHVSCTTSRSANFGENSKAISEINNNAREIPCSVKPIPNGCLKRNTDSFVHQNAQSDVSMNQNGCQTDTRNVKTVMITHKESLMTETFRGQTRLKFTALGCIMYPIACDKSKGLENYRYEPIVLVFQGPSVKWYDVILSAAVYEFDQLKYVDYKVPSSMQYRVKTSVQRSKARRTVTVPTDTHINRIFLQDHSVQPNEGVKDIEDILSTECKDGLVSVIGRIVGRKHCESGLPPKGVGFNEEKLRIEIQRNLGVSMIGNQCVQLQLKSLTNTSEITIYMKLERTSYPLGLIPGTVLKFERLERKTSKRGTVYCHYISVSSCTVISFTTPTHSSQEKQIEDMNRNGARVVYILDKLHDRDSNIFLCQGRIYQIISLKLECKCCLCDSYNDIPIAMFLQQLCNSSSVKTSWQFQLKPFYNQNIHTVKMEDLEVRNVHVGDTTILTKGLPYWTLECIDLKHINYSTALLNS
ncbi:hypothetical protein LOTGIDRAFT_165926 [Lottia gigantea]|uniref:CST complex subunit CTC1 n=1 Tax=Lottia gigantea TaxID=225164 RepID=V3ZB06_LOTGI|nr:hypothetical protein LOTGIDRAFT_165926 [Lottia gigantea]ESO88183.1 hypothetical protein LOTGIDRAFT_165926 [Lottia gigantea]